MLNQYFKDIYKTYKTGDATEASYYSDLKKLLESFLRSKGIDPNITIQPRKTKAGIPDFTIRKDKDLIGYIEAKDLSIKDLETIEDAEQIKRYKEKLPNFILTNYFDFWLWRRDVIDDQKGKWVKKVTIGQPISLKLNIVPQGQKEKEFFDLLGAFFSYYLPERKTAKSLAIELASRAQLLRPYIIEELNNNIETEIDRIYSAFQTFLIPDLTKEDFADIYAQTITYGLFTARLRYQGKDFNRFLAQKLIPKNIQILCDTFNLVSHDRLTESLAWIIDDMATVLAHADIERIKKELHREKGGDDPLMHFYETFLAEYDPKKRKARGVYYTPFPVVSYITRSINILLKEKFDKKMGFASEGVTLLDPASGTLTFPANSIMLAKEEIDKSPIAGSWLQIVKNHILKNYYAFELLMAPYIIGHLKTSLLLEDLGYDLQNGERFQLYLTNTLDLSEVKHSQMPFVAGLSEEAKKAKEVKEKIPVLVVMGNPPYSFSHSEQSGFVKDIMKDYLIGLGVEKEKKKGVMQDEYIRFIRFAHWKIEKAGQGIIGMITNNSYLDGIIHRAMRKKILEDFDEIYILNLHGNSRLKEKTLEGGKDENVFDIQQGVGIILLVKKEGLKKKISYFDLYGLREEKYEFLEKHSVKNTMWQKLKLKEPNFFFIPRDIKGEEIYQKFVSLRDIFEKSGSGVITRRDNFAIGDNKEELKRRVEMFSNKSFDKETLSKIFNIKDTYEWNLEKAREFLKKDKNIEKKITNYLYRIFDKKWIIYDDAIISRRSVILRDSFFDRNNIALITTRILSSKYFRHVFVSDILGDICTLSNKGKETNYFFPLYIYNQFGQNKIFTNENVRKINFTNKLWKNILAMTKPEVVFNYIYAILYSNTYRGKYNEFLKIDFPRIPFTKDAKLFHKVAELGKELIDLHLLKSSNIDKPIASFLGQGNNVVKKREFISASSAQYASFIKKSTKIRRTGGSFGIIKINDTQYFQGVPEEVWNYYIGGYQVLDKWLKDRIGKILSPEDINHYLKIITALKYTIELQEKIDKIYPEIETNLIK